VLNYEWIGNPEGDIVVCLHGFLESNDMWKQGCFAKSRCHCLLIELPGHGMSSSIVEDAYTVSNCASAVYLLLEKLKVKKYSIVGHSLGGYVAIELAKKKDFRKLILLNSNFWEDSTQKKLDRLRVAKLVTTKFPRFVNEAIPNLFAYPDIFQTEIEALINKAKLMHSSDVAIMTLAMMNRTDNSNWAEENTKKILFIQGTKDQTMPKEISRQKCEENNINYVELTASGHMSAYETAFETNAIIHSFLK
jgi:pimeloyl-ACP methyl ester carboxylesterase